MKEPLPAAAARLSQFLGRCGSAAVIGGLAIIARVRPRTTDDLDVVVAAIASDIPRLLEVARGCGYRWSEKDVPDFIDMGLIRLESAEGKEDGYGLDIILADGQMLARVVERATPVSFAGLVLPVATLEDLVLLKLDANRPVDIDDVLSIKDAFGPTLDFVYLRRCADELRIRARLDLYFSPP